MAAVAERSVVGPGPGLLALPVRFPLTTLTWLVAAFCSLFALAQDHCAYCFDTLVAHFGQTAAPEPEFAEANCPLFVTWSKLSRNGESRLRGCIGSLQPLFLRRGLRDYALTSALRDRRFAPIQAAELASLECTVSLLTNFELARDHLDWVVGTHGLILEFSDHQGTSRSATYLPQIAAEEGWTKAYTIDSLIRKAGYDGARTDVTGMKVTRYQSSLLSMDYAGYLNKSQNGNDGHVNQLPN